MANDNSGDLKNGKRPAPSTNPADVEISTDFIPPNVEKIRVGRDFQAVIPKLLVLPTHRRERLNKKALLVWAPTENISEEKLSEYILLSKERYGYNSEQALGMLYWHHHNMEKALNDLGNFAPLPDEWSPDDKVTFEATFNNNGKNFLRLKQMLPDKPIAALVKYYYLWKNKKKKTSVLDRHAKKLAIVRTNENQNGSGEGSGSTSADSEPDDKKDIGEGSSKQSCSICGVFVTMLQQTSKGSMCGTCHTHFKRTNGGIRPTLGPPRPNNRHLNVARNKRLPPRGMYVNHDDLQAIASEPDSQGDIILLTMDDEVVSLKCKIQSNKQDIGQMQKKIKLDVNELRNSDPTPTSRITSRWSNADVLLAIEGIRKYGNNFKAIAETMGTKSQAQVKTFFAQYRKRYKLDEIVRKYNADQNSIIELSDDDDEQVTSKDDSSPSVSRPNTPSSMVSGTRLINNLSLSNPKAHQTAAAAK